MQELGHSLKTDEGGGRGEWREQKMCRWANEWMNVGYARECAGGLKEGHNHGKRKAKPTSLPCLIRTTRHARYVARGGKNSTSALLRSTLRGASAKRKKRDGQEAGERTGVKRRKS